jgi:hypothetical protein
LRIQPMANKLSTIGTGQSLRQNHTAATCFDQFELHRKSFPR